MLKFQKREIRFLAVLVIFAQIGFAILSPHYLKPVFETKLYVTVGVKPDRSDLNKLNEAAHYFGQTIIGWTKFPHFRSDLIQTLELNDTANVSAHIQERQNLILTLSTPEPLSADVMPKIKNFLQSKIDQYNQSTRTAFLLTNADFEQIEIRKTYPQGALITLFLSLVIGFGILLTRRELQPTLFD